MLILDDATAAVDPETEDLIRRGMKFVMRGRTTFVIAHRISTVKQADLVMVMEHGKITQTGTHEELMEQDGHYREIAAAQLYRRRDGIAEPGGCAVAHDSACSRWAKVSRRAAGLAMGRRGNSPIDDELVQIGPQCSPGFNIFGIV